jgi:mono/diheme cytochrome c family protein
VYNAYDVVVIRLAVMKTFWCFLVSSLLLSACATQSTAPPTGAQTFATNCASCHGPLGEGDGPVAAAIRVNVPNLRTLSQRNGGQFPADAVTSYIDGRDLPAAHGDRLMPIWGDVFEATGRLVANGEGAKARIDAVVAYLRELQYRD